MTYSADRGDERSPAHRCARIGRDVIEDVLLEVKGLGGRVDRSPIVEGLEQAILALHGLAESSRAEASHLDVLQAARDGIRQASEAISGQDLSPRALAMCGRLRSVERALEQAREATIDAVVAGQQADLRAELAGRARERVPSAEPFGVSLSRPRLHHLDRPALRAHVDVEPEDFGYDEAVEQPETRSSGLETPEDEHDLDVMPDPDPEEDEPAFGPVDPAKRLPLVGAAAPDAAPTMQAGLAGETAQLERLLRTCFEDIGAMGNLRRLEDHERYDWIGIERFETRMCESLDAAVALAEPFFSVAAPGGRAGGLDLLAHAVRYGREAITADPGRTFARTFVLASVAGEDTVRAAVLALKQSPPYTYPAQAEALRLGPNPAVAPAMARLTSDDDPRLVTLALEVLEARGEVEIAAATTLLDHPAEEVRLAAVAALGAVREREAAAKLLVDLCEGETDDDVFVAAIEALVALGSPEGTALTRERLVDELEEPDDATLRADLRTRLMYLLGLAGQADDYLLLERLYFGHRGQALALGLHGHVRLVDRLIDALGGAAAGGVLLGLSGQMEAARALHRITGAPLLRAREGGVADPYDVVTDPRAWIGFWAQAQAGFDPELRYRFGAPFSALKTVAELGADDVPCGIRRHLGRELDLWLGPRTLDLGAFAVEQRAALGRARASIAAAVAGGEARVAAGRWLG